MVDQLQPGQEIVLITDKDGDVLELARLPLEPGT